MSSTFYRHYRPDKFDDVLGQDHISQVLKTAVTKKLIDHAYLFSGPRGTGKTTVARLLARAINCQNLDNGNPCNKCAMCLEIKQNAATDILEIDAASNRGIDEIRELRDKIGYAPTRATYKVYIIDEVHMLTKEAFNALLKTLEEPPAHAIFILATTELHKVPQTIISRAQRYQFHRANHQQLEKLLSEVATKEGIKVNSEAVKVLVERADGSYRDGLTLLGNLKGQTKLMDAESVRQLVGLPPSQTVEALLSAIVEGQPSFAQKILNESINDGQDVALLVKAMADHCKEQIFASLELKPTDQTVIILEELLSVLAQSRFSTDPTALLIARIFQLCFRNQNSAPQVMVKPVVDIQKAEISSQPPAVDSVSAGPPIETDSFWSQFLEQIKAQNHALYAVIRSAALENITNDKLIIAVKFRFYAERLAETRNRQIVESTASNVTGRQIRLETIVKTDLELAKSKDDDLLATVVDVFELEEVA